MADCSTRPTQLRAYSYLEDVGKKGGNNVASMIMEELNSQGLIPTASTVATHQPVNEINLFFDNCGGQNKNKMVIRLLTFLVKWRVCKTARAAFLVRGHTKNDCDRIFNLMKKVYRTCNVYTPDEMIEAIGKSADVAPVAVEGFKDWNKLQDKYMAAPKSGTVNVNHVFSVLATEPNTLYTQEHIDAPMVAQTIVLKAYHEADPWLQFEQPEDILPTGIQYIKWAELFDKWKKFVPEEARGRWKYYCEDLPPDKRAALKGHTQESKKKRKQRERVQEEEEENTEEKPSAEVETGII